MRYLSAKTQHLSAKISTEVFLFFTALLKTLVAWSGRQIRMQPLTGGASGESKKENYCIGQKRGGQRFKAIK